MPSFFRRYFSEPSGSPEQKGLGYRYVRDPRSDNFLMGPRVADLGIPLDSPDWVLRGDILDQGSQGSCVGHGWGHWLNCDDVNGPSTRVVDHAYALDIYNWAQLNDEWTDTPPAEGTSVLAGAKACVNFGHLKEGYLWGRTVDDLLRWLGNFGSAVIGSLWRSNMIPDRDGFIRPPFGKIDGGHCYLARKYRTINGRKVITFPNSWGGDWADNGEFHMYAEDFASLLSGGHYSICTPLELAPVAPAPPDLPPEPEPARIRVDLRNLNFAPNRYYGEHLEIVAGRRARWKADPLEGGK